MEAIGSEVGQKMRSAIKAKLMELGCYVDDELPDYVMVMVANKRTRSQMEDDLQLFLTNNTEAFVSWLHQVLQKLQEVTINTNLVANVKKSKVKRSLEESSLKKERREKDKKKDKEKFKAKLKVKAKKSKKDKRSSSKEPERIRPNVPPLLMNLEKESSPSITDVFAGQILKSHGIKSNTPTLLEDIEKESSLLDLIGNGKSTRKLLKRNRFPIIDPNTVSLGSEPGTVLTPDLSKIDSLPSVSDVDVDSSMAVLTGLPRAEKIKEMNEINAKIQTLKRRLVEQIESGSEDEDFINLRTEAEELMGVDFNEDNLMPPISLKPIVPIPEVKTPPRMELQSETPEEEEESLTPVKTPPLPKPREVITAPNKSPLRLPELPLIELNLPKRPLRDRLGVRPYSVAVSSEGAFVTRTVNMVNPYQSSKEKSDGKHDSNTDRMHLNKSGRPSNDKGSLKNRLTMRDEPERGHGKEVKSSSNKEEPIVKRRIGSRVVPLIPQREEEAQVAVASVVRAPPRPSGMSGAPHSQLLMRAVADAHKSLLSMPPKNITETVPKKKAHVLPMRRNVDPKKIIIEVSSNNIPNPNSYERRNSNSDFEIEIDTESLGDMESDGDCRKNIGRHKEDASEYVPEPLRNKVTNFKSVDYVPTHIEINSRTGKEEGPVISRILHFKNEKPEPSGKDPQFVVTLDGLDPNIFLEKKLVKETQEDELNVSKAENTAKGELTDEKKKETEDEKKTNGTEKTAEERAKENPLHRTNIKISLSNLSNQKSLQKTKAKTEESVDSSSNTKEIKSNEANVETEPLSKNNSPKKSSGSKRKLEDDLKFNHKDSFSPIVFRDDTKSKHDGDQVDTIGTSKYDSLPSLPPDKKRKPSLTLAVREATCRFYPDCRLGSACEFYHPVSLATPPVTVPPPCRAFPACVFGDNCAYGHPLCKFDKLCTRKGCPYMHGARTKTKKLVNQVASTISPAVASRVVPVSNYKSISATPLPPICKYYPSCSNLSCHYYHPKLCHFGKFCINKVECNFYHHDMPSAAKWTS